MNCFSKLGQIKMGDLWRGFILAVIMAVLSVIYESVQKGGLDISWNAVILAGIGAGISYLIKNLSTGENGRLLTNSPGTRLQ